MANIFIPVGKENFEEIRACGYYYIDKTKFIAELVQDIFSVNLITRPRRFGKTMTMCMLETFFDIRKDSRKFFDGLEITKYKKICEEWMNQWPTLFLSLKDIACRKFFDSYEQFTFDISSLCVEHSYLLNSDKMLESDKELFLKLERRTASKTEIKNSLYFLTRIMYEYYGKPVILLIDEYDVPLAKAHEYQYYNDMLDVIRGFLNTALKTNKFLKFAVVTGCLRVAKESIFTGTNLFVMNSIYEGSYMNTFGFTEEEVRKIFQDAEIEEHLEETKKWYDGYRFGSYDIYCPWDVVNYAAALSKNPDKKPGNYWKDTSHNDIIKSFISSEDIYVNEQFETLLSGGYVRVEIREDLTYHLEDSENKEKYFWSILYLTGYLTCAKPEKTEGEELMEGEVLLKIPNEEVKTIFADAVEEWFRDTLKTKNRKELFYAWWNGEEEKLTSMIKDILFDTISYFDYKEDYYHAFLTGLFAGSGYSVASNRETGKGRADIIVKDRKNRRAIIIETKHSNSEKMLSKDCEEALEQIDFRQYAQKFLKGYKEIFCYGAAFFEKTCLIKKAELSGLGKGTIYEIE